MREDEQPIGALSISSNPPSLSLNEGAITLNVSLAAGPGQDAEW